MIQHALGSTITVPNAADEIRRARRDLDSMLHERRNGSDRRLEERIDEADRRFRHLVDANPTVTLAQIEPR